MIPDPSTQRTALVHVPADLADMLAVVCEHTGRPAAEVIDGLIRPQLTARHHWAVCELARRAAPAAAGQ